MKRIHERLKELGFVKKSVSDGLVIYFDVGADWSLWPNNGVVGFENESLGIEFTITVLDARKIDIVENRLVFWDACGNLSVAIGLSGMIRDNLPPSSLGTMQSTLLPFGEGESDSYW